LGAAGAVAAIEDESSGSSSSERWFTTSDADDTGWVDSSAGNPDVMLLSTPASIFGIAGVGATGIIASGSAAGGAGAPEDDGEAGDANAVGRGDDVLPDDAATIDSLGEGTSSRRDTLCGRLRAAVCFLISAIWFGNGGCRFISSGALIK
jgi:hypothetical protein